MKIETQTLLNKQTEEDKRFTVTLTTDELKSRISIGEGHPNDMTLSRDLGDVYALPDMLVAAYEAGKRGEELEFPEL